MDTNTKQTFRSDSLYLCCYLLSKGMTLVGIEKVPHSNKLEFCFEETPYREALVHDFYFAKRDDPVVLVDVRSFIEAIKNLKERMHQA